MRRLTHRARVLPVVGLLCATHAVRAQGTPELAERLLSCEGLVISRIDIQRSDRTLRALNEEEITQTNSISAVRCWRGE